jgi:hypothetical protein
MHLKKVKILNRPNFIKALEAISKINDSAILSFKEAENKQITSIASSVDNTMIIYCEMGGIESDFRGNLNIPDIKKLVRVLDAIQADEVILTINNNSIEYTGKTSRFKYHMYEDGFLVPPTINISKVQGFAYDINFTLKKDTIQSIIRGSAFATDTNKLYLYTLDNRLKGELTDRSRHNTDVFELDLGEVAFDLSPIPFNLDNIKLVSLVTNDISFGINTKYGVSIIDIQDSDIKLKYILTSLTQ